MTGVQTCALPILTPEDIRNKFGEPALVHVQADILHFLYPDMGLDAILDQSGEAMLQFVKPDEFSQVLDSLGLTEEALVNTKTQQPLSTP